MRTGLEALKELLNLARRRFNISRKEKELQEKYLIEIYKKIRTISKEEIKSLNSSSELKKLLEISPSTVLKLLQDLEMTGEINIYDFLLTAEELGFKLLHPCYPKEVLELISSILSPSPSSSVYNPYPNAYGVAYWLSSKIGCKVITIDPLETEIPKLLNENLKQKITYSFGEPLCMELKEKFEYSFSFIWKTEFLRDMCNDPNKREWREIALIEHLLKVTTKKAAMIVPASFMLKLKSPYVRTRKKHIEFLDLVILLPNNIFFSSRTDFCLLLFNKENPQKELILFDASSLYEESSARKANILDTQTILKTLNRNSNGEFLLQLPKSKLLKFDKLARIHPKILNKDNIELYATFNAIEKKQHLSDVADIISSPFSGIGLKFMRKGQKEYKISEIQLKDISESGIIEKASTKKRIHTDSDYWKRAIVKEDDIIISIRGTTGKIGIVKNIPEGEIWLPSQTLAIIRPRKIDPRALFVYLRSQIGRHLIKLIECGETIGFIPIRSLKKLEIPAFSKEQVEKLIEAYERERQGYLKIEKLKKEIEEYKNSKLNQILQQLQNP